VIEKPDPFRYRWAILSVFVLSTAINYLDRQTLAHLATEVQGEFSLSDAQYGLILTAFSLAYAASAPFAGLLIDRIGLNRGISLAVGVWSLAGMATGFTQGLGGLVACRATLGMAEAGGIPGAGKAIHQYLKPAERALGNAVNQMGVSLGAMAAPPIATFLSIRYGWRIAFAATGVLGLLWIPLWLRASRGAHVMPAPKMEAGAGREMLRDRRLWAFMLANALGMVGYSLWTNWTTKYLVKVHSLSYVEATRYAWLPPLAFAVGGFAGGAFSLRLVQRGLTAPRARFRVCLWAAVISLSTAAVPLAPTAVFATLGICLSSLAVSAFSVNMYSLPLDVFGGPRAAFAVSMLVASYGAAQAIISPVFGKTIDLFGYAPVTTVAALTPFAACALLWSARTTR
jgi:MFS transporter, ACS family, hexuronate transporter